MIQSVRVPAPCKINLHLRVLGRRNDGFHDIESVFQLVSLADEVSVSMTGCSGDCTVVSPFMELPPENTVTKAVSLFRGATGLNAGVRIEVTKRVPAGAGLGGGSSDAAATLLALDRLFGTDLGRPALAGLGALIGSDVPFFLSSPAAIVTGRGERVAPIEARDGIPGVLVWPGVHSPTPEAYGLVDRWRESGREGSDPWPAVPELEPMYRRLIGEWRFRNSFQAPLEERFPVIREAREALEASGAVFAAMSGSGSAVFGLFADIKEAVAVQKRLSARWNRCAQFLLLASSPMR